MQLVINTKGTALRKKDDNFEVSTSEKKMSFSPKKIDSILMTTGVLISSDAITFALEYNIDIIFIDVFGNPVGRVWHSKLGSTTLIRRKQLEYSLNFKGLKLATEMVLSKIENQYSHLEKLSKTRDEKQEELLKPVSQLKDIYQKLSEIKYEGDGFSEKIMGYEGSAGKIYFETLNFIIPERFRFEGRSRNPAKDEFNAMLNYGYGVLYSKVEKGCIIAGLDPYLGFLHSDDYNKKSLVFDVIEPFRIYAEEVVIHLFAMRQVKRNYFDLVKNGMLLNTDGKKLLITALNENFEKTIRYNNRNIAKKDTIQFFCHRIANEILEKSAEIEDGETI